LLKKLRKAKKNYITCKRNIISSTKSMTTLNKFLLKANSLKVLEKMSLLVKPSKSMEMESKKNTAMLRPILKMNSLRVMAIMKSSVKN
jgi:hypothetical protein